MRHICLYIIANIIIRTFGEVESKGRLIRSKIVDVEDEFLGQVFLGPPYHPPNSGVDQPIFVSAHIDALHQWQPEVPFQFGVQKRRDEPTARRIYMDWCVPSEHKEFTLLHIIIIIIIIITITIVALSQQSKYLI